MGIRVAPRLWLSTNLQPHLFDPRNIGLPGPFPIGSGVGFILVNSETEWQRVSGTSLGGGTYYGLCHMLTGA